MYDLNSAFDIEQHKAHYINYLEVIITRDGVIEYAIPSHQEKLIEIACDQLGLTREESGKKCPVEYWFNFLEWLCNLTGCISVWNNYFIAGSDLKPNTMQIKAMRDLVSSGLYTGRFDYT